MVKERTLNPPSIIEDKLAGYAHEAWSGWMKYIFSKSYKRANGDIVIPKWAVERWIRQSNTKYSELPEEEKKSDLDESDKILKIIKTAFAEMYMSGIDG